MTDQGAASTPFECCSPTACGHPRAACRQRSGAAGPAGCCESRYINLEQRSAFTETRHIPLLVLDLCLNIVNRVRGLDLEGDRLAREAAERT